MKNKHIKMIAFDLFGVLITEGHLISNGLMHLLPSGTDKKQVKTAYEKFNIGMIKEADFWQDIGQPYNAQLRKAFLNDFSLDPEYEQILRLQQHYRLAILSNFPLDWANYLNDKFHFKTAFEPIIFSGHVQCKKPQAEIYEILIKQSGLSPHEIAFVDDRLENLSSAHELGIVTVYYQREKQIHSHEPDFKISKLADLNKIFYI